MKTILLTTLLIICYTLAVFAQSPSPVHAHIGFLKSKKVTPGTYSLSDSLNTNGKLNVPFSTRNFIFHDLKDKEVKIGQLATGNDKVQTGMPVWKPKGSFPMPVYRPDTTIRFTLLIKEYKKLPQNGVK